MICEMTLAHLPLVMENAQPFFDESVYSGLTEMDRSKVEETFAAIIDAPHGIALFDNTTGSYFFGLIDEHWFANYKYAYDVCTYVPIEHRGNGVGFRLLKTYVKFAEILGAQEILLGDIAGIDRATLFKMHKKLGLTDQTAINRKFIGGNK